MSDGRTKSHDPVLSTENMRLARLIHAAPDLLAACEAVVEHVGDSDHPEHCRCNCYAVLDPLRAAIAKAKGAPKLTNLENRLLCLFAEHFGAGQFTYHNTHGSFRITIEEVQP